MHRLILVAALLGAASTTVIADTLVLRDGRRVEGALLSVRNGIIEFEELRGNSRGRRLEFDRDEVVRIEFGAPRRGSGASDRPFGLRERIAIVNASDAWSDTSVDLRAGQTVYFEATGEIRWGRDRRDGPQGESNSPRNPNRPMPNRPAGALIAKIGSDSSDYFFIGGEQGPVRVRTSGRLYLGVNDDFFNDNAGHFRVVVYH